MHIEGNRTTVEKVSISVSAEDAWGKLRNLIHKKEGMQRADYLRKRGNKYVFTEDDHHPHGSPSESELTQKPTKRQVDVWKALDVVEELVNFYELERN